MPKEFGKTTELLPELIEELGKLAACDSSFGFVRAGLLNWYFDRTGYTEQALPFVKNVVNRLKKLQESTEFQDFKKACESAAPIDGNNALIQSDYSYLTQILQIVRSYPSELPKPHVTPYNTSTTDRTYLFDCITRKILADYFVSGEIQGQLLPTIQKYDQSVMRHLRRQRSSPAPTQAAQFIIAEALFSLDTLTPAQLVEKGTMPDTWNWTSLVDTYYKFNGQFAAADDELVDVQLDTLSTTSLNRARIN